jgi:hypothetical protein
MRPLFALVVLLLCFNILTPERDASTLLGDYLHASVGHVAPSLIALKLPAGNTDRLNATITQPHQASDQAPEVEALGPPPYADPVSPTFDPERVPEISLDDLCSALLTSAQENDLPVPFFANLIWQESRLQDDAVSPVGALGIAQFMPEVAMASGLDNPFDPLQAIPASARLLRELREQFGNLGFVAAAYNAGAHRVSEWLQHRRALPRETINYVVRVTGRSAEDWRKSPPDDNALTFVRPLPCRGLPAFADLEQAQLQEAQLEKSEADLQDAEMQLAKTETQHPQSSRQTETTAHAAQRAVTVRGRQRRHLGHQETHVAVRYRHGGRRQAERIERESPDKRKRARGNRPAEVRIGMTKGRLQDAATEIG